MADLISRAAFKRHYAWWGDTDERRLFDDIVDAQEAVDAVPVVHARWENGGTGIYDNCTACGESIYLAFEMRYCPNCGARMDGKE